MESEKSATAVKDGITDVLIYSIRSAGLPGIDIHTANQEKIVKKQPDISSIFLKNGEALTSNHLILSQRPAKS